MLSFAHELYVSILVLQRNHHQIMHSFIPHLSSNDPIAQTLARKADFQLDILNFLLILKKKNIFNFLSFPIILVFL